MRRALDHAEVSRWGTRRRKPRKVVLSCLGNKSRLSVHRSLACRADWIGLMLAKYHAGSLPAIFASFPGGFCLYWRSVPSILYVQGFTGVCDKGTAVLRMAFSLRLPFEVLSSSRREPHLSPSPSVFFRLPQPFRLPSFRRPARTRSFPGSCSTPRTATSSRRYGGSDHLLLFLAAEAARSTVGQNVLCTGASPSLILPPRIHAPSLAPFPVCQFLEEREMGRSSVLVPPPSLQRFIGAQGFGAFSGDRPSKRSR